MAQATQLREITMFSQLSAAVLKEVYTALQKRGFKAGEILFNQGDPGEELFIVEKGRIAIFVPNPDDPGSERPLRIFVAGESFGEMALIDNKPRSASARCLDDTEVLVLTGTDFLRLLRTYPDMSLQVMSALNERIRYTTNFLSEVQEWVQRIAEGKYDRDFAPSADYQDRSIEALAAEFAQMAAKVQQREEELRQEVIKLRIHIDNEKRKRQVGEITETDYFQHLRTRAQELREETEE